MKEFLSVLGSRNSNTPGKVEIAFSVCDFDYRALCRHCHSCVGSHDLVRQHLHVFPQIIGKTFRPYFDGVSAHQQIGKHILSG